MTNPANYTIRAATSADAAALHRVIQAAFAARRPIEPPADALADTQADIAQALLSGEGVCVEIDGELVAGLLLQVTGQLATLRRVSVLPKVGRQGIARQLIAGALRRAVELGCSRVELVARREFPELVQWWQGHGFEVLREVPQGFVLGRQLPVIREISSAAAMQQLGRELAKLLRPGDLLIATGDLGAGKTTLAQGIGDGLGVSGAIISPTFVISRLHPNPGDGPDFVHVDAYRMSDAAELADIDLDTSLPTSVTLVEWGEGKAEWLAAERLEIFIERSSCASQDRRSITLDGIGPRWVGALDSLREKN